MLAFDTETHLIQPGTLQPKIVCVSFSRGNISGVLSPDEGCDLVEEAMAAGELIVGHNIAFDLGVLVKHRPSIMSLIFKQYEKDLVRDTMIKDQLIRIRTGSFKFARPGDFSLAGLAKRYLKMSLDKSDDGWRMRYHELDGIPIDQWPKEAVEYSRLDAVATYRVFNIQERSPDEGLQCRAAWALHMIACNGMITDGEAVFKLERELQDSIVTIRQNLIDAKILKWTGPKKEPQRKLTKDTKLIKSMVEEAFNGNPPKTDPSEKHPEGQTAIDGDTLEKTKIPILVELVSFMEAEKLLTTFVPVLKQGIETPINPRYKTLVETGRTSCSAPNAQNLPRRAGVRDCFVPRPGHFFAACDYSAAELIALAQVTYTMFKESRMRDALIEGKDLHVEVAAQLMNIDYATAMKLKNAGSKDLKHNRQLAKVLNFGLPGGLGADTFVEFAAGSGVTITPDQARNLKKVWLESWPEMKKYFEWSGEVTDEKFGPRRVAQFFSKRVRGDISFTQACNTMFQGLVADGAKLALFEVVKECLTPGTDLFGSRPWAFIHDEIILEVPVDNADAAARRLSHVMERELQKVTPDVPVTSTVHLMSKWIKEAEAMYDEEGKLIPWKK